VARGFVAALLRVPRAAAWRHSPPPCLRFCSLCSANSVSLHSLHPILVYDIDRFRFCSRTSCFFRFAYYTYMVRTAAAFLHWLSPLAAV